MKTSFTTRLAQLLMPAQFPRPALLGLLTLLGTGFTCAAQAPQPTVQVAQPDAESLRISINNAARKPAHLRVVHLDNGHWLLNETHRDASYGTRLKFNGLPTGRYQVMLRVGADRYRYTVQVETPAPGATTIAVRETSTRRVETGLATASL